MDPSLSQSLDIYRQGGRYKLRGRIDAEVLCETETADEAISAAFAHLGEAGGEVALQPGNFFLRRPVRLVGGVCLRGAGPATRLIVADEAPAALIGEGIDRAVVRDLSILAEPGGNPAALGIRLDDCGGCAVKDVFFCGLAEHGLFVGDFSFLCEIRGCSFADCGVSAIRLEQFSRRGRGGDYAPNLVSHCVVYGGGRGVELDKAILVNLVGCQLYQCREAGFHLRGASNSVVISGCRTMQIRGDAVVVEGSHEINLTGNIFCWHEGHGIVLRDVTWGTVTGNNVIDTGSINVLEQTDEHLFFEPVPPDAPRFDGIRVVEGSRGLTVTGNAVFNWGAAPLMGRGIFEDESCAHNVFTANNVNWVREAAVVSRGAGSRARENTAVDEPAFLGTDANGMHVFDVRNLEAFIADQRRLARTDGGSARG